MSEYSCFCPDFCWEHASTAQLIRLLGQAPPGHVVTQPIPVETECVVPTTTSAGAVGHSVGVRQGTAVMTETTGPAPDKVGT